MRQENEFLRQKLDALARQLFGKKSEQLDPAQLQLLFQELEAPGPAVGKGFGPQAPEAAPARPKKAPASPRPHAARPRAPARDRGSHRAAARAGRARAVAADRGGDHRAARLRAGPFLLPSHRAPEIRAPRRARCRAGHRPAAAVPPGQEHRHPQPGGANPRGQILRPSPALPAGGDLPKPPRRHPHPPDDVRMGRRGRRLAAPHLRGNPPRGAGGRLRADR